MADFSENEQGEPASPERLFHNRAPSQTAVHYGSIISGCVLWGQTSYPLLKYTRVMKPFQTEQNDRILPCIVTSQVYRVLSVGIKVGEEKETRETK